MNTLSGLTFYDSLSKLTIGFLLTWFWVPGLINAGCTSCSCYNCVICEFCGCSCCVPELNAIQTAFFLIICFIAGCLWQGLLCFLPDKCIGSDGSYKGICEFIPYGKRNYLDWIAELKKKTNIMFECKDIKNDYFQVYYRVEKNGLMGNIHVLEALEAFLRTNALIYVLYVCYFVFLVDLECNNSFFDGYAPIFCIIKPFFVVFLILLYLYLWRYYNKKVYELVWEADKYLEIIRDSEK